MAIHDDLEDLRNRISEQRARLADVEGKQDRVSQYVRDVALRALADLEQREHAAMAREAQYVPNAKRLEAIARLKGRASDDPASRRQLERLEKRERMARLLPRERKLERLKLAFAVVFWVAVSISVLAWLPGACETSGSFEDVPAECVPGGYPLC